MKIFENKLTLPSYLEIPYFVEVLFENISIDTLLTEKHKFDGFLLQEGVALVITWLQNFSLVKP